MPHEMALNSRIPRSGFNIIRTLFLVDKRGVAVLEFAIIMPLLLLITVAILSYGGYFFMAHAIQQMANDGARVAIAGLDNTERQALVGQSVSDSLTHYSILPAARTSWILDETSQRLIVSVSTDASSTPFFAMSTMLPMPGSTIRRQAVVSVGGY